MQICGVQPTHHDILAAITISQISIWRASIASFLSPSHLIHDCDGNYEVGDLSKKVTDDSSRPRHIHIVIGMHRSGTSLCAHILSVLGIDMADDILPNDGNAQGHWERLEIVAFHNRILTLFNRDWFESTHAYALPRGWWADPRVRAIRNEMVDWLRPRIITSRHFGFKDPRTTCLLPLWREVCRELGVHPRFILCVRHPALVAISLAARGDVVDPRDSEHRWVVYNARAVVDLGLQPVCVLPYGDWFDDEILNLRRLAEFLGEEHRMEDATFRRIAADIVAPQLRHHVLHPGALNDAIPARMYRLLVTSANQAVLSPELCDLAVECCRFEQLTELVQQIASMTRPLQIALSEREVQITAGSAREAELHASMITQAQRSDAATGALQAEITAGSAREAELHASVIAQAQRADAATAALEAEITAASAREAELHASVIAHAQRSDAATAALQAEITAASAREAELHASVIAHAQRSDAATAALQAEITAASAREAELHASVIAHAQRSDAATAALQAEVIAASAREVELRASVISQAQRADAATAALQAEITAGSAREAELHASVIAQAQRADAETAALQAEIIAGSAREAELHASVIAQAQRADTATASLQAQITAGSACEAELHASAFTQEQRADAVKAAFQAKIAAALAREAGLRASVIVQVQRADAATAALQAEIAATSAREAELEALATIQVNRSEMTVIAARDAELRILVLQNDLHEAKEKLSQFAANLIELRARYNSLNDNKAALATELAQQKDARLSIEADVALLQDQQIAAEQENALRSVFVDRILGWHQAYPDTVSFAVNRLIAKARRFARRRKWNIAERLYREVLFANPCLLPIWVQYGHMIKNQNHLSAALGAYRRAVELDPVNMDALSHLNYVQEQLNQTRDAKCHSLASHLLSEDKGWTSCHPNSTLCNPIKAVGISRAEVGQFSTNS